MANIFGAIPHFQTELYPLVDYQFAIENVTVEIVELPMTQCDFPQLCQRLPEGIYYKSGS